jgi:thiosulfate/3-mercaptopyruvate sulfurtransferase
LPSYLKNSTQMKKVRFGLFLVVLFSANCVNAQKGLNKIMVSQEWMQEHLDDKNLVVLHVQGKEEYDKGHIQGAQFIDFKDYAVMDGDLAWEIPPEDELNKNLRERGVSSKSKVVLVYGRDDHASTFRLFFTLDYFGLSKNVVILDGGLKGWKFKGLNTTTENNPNEKVAEGGLKFKKNTSIKVDKDYVKRYAGTDKLNVIDARRVNYYEGAEETRDNYKRSGHIAGAGNVCWLDIVDENMFMRDYGTIKSLFEAQGVGNKDEVVAYCHVGLRASVIYTVAKGLGYKARLYDGSYNEWDTLSDDYPVKTGKERK